jgi:hypothetical protein
MHEPPQITEGVPAFLVGGDALLTMVGQSVDIQLTKIAGVRF